MIVPGILVLPETFGPVILRRRRIEKLKQMGLSPAGPATSAQDKTAKRITKGLARPFILLGTQPIIQVLAVYFGFYFGLYQLSIATYRASFSISFSLPLVIF